MTFITEYSLAPVYSQPHFFLAPTHSPTLFPSLGFPNFFSLPLINLTCSHLSILISLFPLHGTLISQFYYPLFSSFLPSPPHALPPFLISLFLSLHFYLCLCLSLFCLIFFFIPIMAYSHFGRKLFSDHTPPDGTLPLQLLYTSLPYLFSSYSCSYQKLCIWIFFFTFLMSSHVDYNIEDSRDSLSLIHWWAFCFLSQNSCDCRKDGRGENFTSWPWFKGIKLLKYIELRQPRSLRSSSSPGL